MIRAHTVQQVRAAEDVLLARTPDGALMAQAASGLAHAVLDFLGSAYGRRVLLLVGPGNNGGDALFAGAVLSRRGVQVEAWLLAPHVHQRGLEALIESGGRAGRPPSRTTCTWDAAIDGIVGIGGRPGLRAEAEEALALLDGIPVIAVDMPSGVDVDTGQVEGPHVRADLTVTFGTHKIAHLVDPAAPASGAVHLVNLGLDLPEAPVEALQPADVAALLPWPDQRSHKYTRGVVGIRAGSAEYPGAGLLCVSGAVAGLCGMVRYVGDDEVAAQVRRVHPEVVGAGRVQAWVVGSGSGDDAGSHLADALADGVPVVVDADALGHVQGALPAPSVLTPHAGELARMLALDRDEVERRPLEHARLAAERYDAVVLLKGRRTLIAAPAGRTRVNLTGTGWLAAAGAGDVLAGLIGSLLAAGLSSYDAASVGAWLHGAAATQGSAGAPLRMRDLGAAVGPVIAQLDRPEPHSARRTPVE